MPGVSFQSRALGMVHAASAGTAVGKQDWLPGVCVGDPRFSASFAWLVGQPASLEASTSVVPGCEFPVVVVCRAALSWSRHVAVGQPAVNTTACRSPPPEFKRPNSLLRSALSGPPVTVRGVGHADNGAELSEGPFVVDIEANPPLPVSFTRAADARNR